MDKPLFSFLELSIFDYLSETLEVSISLIDTLIMIVVAFIIGFIISYTYMKTSENGNYSKNFSMTMILLPAIISSIILLIGSDIARAFSLAGAFAIIRFRSEPGEPKDIAYVLFAMASGLGLGIGEYIFSVLFVVILCVVMYILSKTSYGNSKNSIKQLKITIPEDLDYEKEFNDIFEKYSISYKLRKVQTTSFGSLIQLYYDIEFCSQISNRELMDDIRIVNSNLDISLTILDK